MTPQEKIYTDHFQCDKIYCEICGKKATGIRIIDDKKPDTDIDNLIALCRHCHDDAHNEQLSKSELRLVHYRVLHGNTKEFGKKK